MLEAYGVSDRGCVRTNNEDSLELAPDVGLYLVADGMGGAQAGERASRLALDSVAEVVRAAFQQGIPPSVTLLEGAFHEANRRVLQLASTDDDLEGMGTTMVGVLVAGDDLIICSVGDSRAYAMKGGELYDITVDQSWVNDVGRRLGIDEETLRTHPMRHVLTMAIGVGQSLRINTYQMRLEPGEQLLLSSDGLHGVVERAVIARVLGSSGTLEQKCATLIQAAKDLGGPDNITALLLRA
ncbi:MAG: protein phosphatase 2C domain-containing protein [Bryobacter sp.]|nr:protein phosphatase 2C domain-containing protein [Bryobacter sp.]